MKTKIFFLVILLAVAGGSWWAGTRFHQPTATVSAPTTGRKVLYYQSSMHPWIRSDKPGKCPICGMDLVPVYEGESGFAAGTGVVALGSNSVSVLNVQTDAATNDTIRRTLHFAGRVVGNSWQKAWFEFTVYERDLTWLKRNQELNILLPAAAGRMYHAQIKPYSTKTFAESDFDPMSGSTTLRAEISDSPVVIGQLGGFKLFNHIYGEAHVIAETEKTLTVSRRAVLSRGTGAIVYIDNGHGYYTRRAVLLGRIGDERAEVLAGLKEGDRVVTNGNLLIDSEAQLAAGE